MAFYMRYGKNVYIKDTNNSFYVVVRLIQKGAFIQRTFPFKNSESLENALKQSEEFLREVTLEDPRLDENFNREAVLEALESIKGKAE